MTGAVRLAILATAGLLVYHSPPDGRTDRLTDGLGDKTLYQYPLTFY